MTYINSEGNIVPASPDDTTPLGIVMKQGMAGPVNMRAITGSDIYLSHVPVSRPRLSPFTVFHNGEYIQFDEVELEYDAETGQWLVLPVKK